MTSADARAVVAQAGLCALDREVVREAARVAADEGAVLHLVCAYQPAGAAARERAQRKLPSGLRLDCEDERVSEAQRILDDARDELPRGLDVRLHLERGDAEAALCRVARRVTADVILAAHAAGRAQRRRAARLVADAPCRVRILDGAADPAAARQTPALRPSSRPEYAFAGIMVAAEPDRPARGR